MNQHCLLCVLKFVCPVTKS